MSLRNIGNAAASLQYTLDEVRFVEDTPAFHTAPVTTPGVSAADLNTHVRVGSEWSFDSVALDDADEDGTLQGSIDSGALALDLAGSAQTNENDSILATLDSSITGFVEFETEFTTPALVNQDWSLKIGLEDGVGNEIQMAFRYRYLFLRNDADTSWSQIKSGLDPSTTYKLSILIDTLGGTADYFIDDVLTARFDEPTSLMGVSQVRFTNLGNATADLEYRIDNLSVIELIPGLVDAAYLAVGQEGDDSPLISSAKSSLVQNAEFQRHAVEDFKSVVLNAPRLDVQQTVGLESSAERLSADCCDDEQFEALADEIFSRF
jgi:hypothetical protein